MWLGAVQEDTCRFFVRGWVTSSHAVFCKLEKGQYAVFWEIWHSAADLHIRDTERKWSSGLGPS